MSMGTGERFAAPPPATAACASCATRQRFCAMRLGACGRRTCVQPFADAPSPMPMAELTDTPRSRSMPSPLSLHPDRALPADPVLRSIARTVYGQTKDLPLVCMHGHVEAQVFADNAPFPDPSALLITPDHYVTRM